MIIWLFSTESHSLLLGLEFCLMHSLIRLKISPEAIALFIACHTSVGDTVFDPFGGSGTTGIAVKLCDKPSPELLKMAKQYGVSPVRQ